MAVTIEVNVVGLPGIVAELQAAPELLAAENRIAMQRAVLIAEAEIKARTPRKTGRLFSAWKPEVVSMGGQIVGHLGDPVSYAGFVEEGTRAHDIVAHGNALMIPVAKGGGFGGGRLPGAPRMGQQVAFFKRVHVRGSTGRHMAAEGLSAAKAAITREFLNAANRVLATIKGL